jgi:uncharacterized YccA/Bax inhibitor family protein
MRYSFTLKDNNQKAYYLFTWFLFYVHVAAAAFTVNNTNEAVKLSMYILLGFYCTIGIVFYVMRKRNKATETFSLLLAFFYAHFWLTQVGVLALVIFAGVFILVTVIKGKRTTVLFSLQGIELTRVFKTIIFPWSAMDNVILKDNILTIDFKTNKLIQVEVANQGTVIDETAFNRFCHEQMQLPQ